MKSFFCNVLIFRSSRSRIFFKLDVLKNFASLTGKHLCWSLILIKLQALRPATLLKTDSNTSVFLWNWRSFFMNSFFYRTPPVAASVVFAANQGNIQWTITLGYNQRLSWNTVIIITLPYIEISIFYQKYGHQIQIFCSLFRQSLNFMTLPSIYNFNILIFLKGNGVSHSNTVHLIVSLSKIDRPIYQEEELTSV